MKGLDGIHKTLGCNGLLIVDLNYPALVELVAKWDVIVEIRCFEDTPKDGKKIVFVCINIDAQRLALWWNGNLDSLTVFRVKGRINCVKG